ncbi:MAG TPA: YafY family protein [Burkholderiaceae bacterium]|nr:YafY family protein [Burkholderiaceae bacterium]
MAVYIGHDFLALPLVLQWRRHNLEASNVSRSERLLALLQLLRSRRHPVPGAELSRSLGVSLRTIYRDIGTLQEQGARIEGEAGLGYVLRPGYLLPPLMFTEEEIEAMVLGSRWVMRHADSGLSESARSALARIASVVPRSLRDTLDAATLLIASQPRVPPPEVDVADIRLAIRGERKMFLRYQSLSDQESTRTVWPFAMGYFDGVCLLVAWCETRNDYRHFRIDRIQHVEVMTERYPSFRHVLLKGWRERQGIAPE